MKGTAPVSGVLLLLALARGQDADVEADVDDRGLHRHRRAAHLAVDAVRKRMYQRVTVFVCWGEEDAFLYRLLSSAGMSAQLLRGRDRTRTEVLRRELSDSPFGAAVILDASCPFADRVLTAASRLRLFHLSNMWVIFENGALDDDSPPEDPGVRDAENEFADAENVTVHRFGAQDREDAVDPNEQAFLEVRPPTTARSRSNLMQEQTDRLTPAADQLLAERLMFVDSDVLWVQSRGQDVEAFEVFRSGQSRPLQAYLVAEASLVPAPRWRWTLSAEQESWLRERRADLQGATLRGSTIIAFPDEYTHIEDNNLRQNDLFPKMNWPVTQNLAYSLNFGMLVYKRDNYGWDDGHGVFDGMMGEMQRHEQDLLATAVFIRDDRLGIIDLVAETFQMRTAVLFRQPSKSSVSNVYVLPFSPGVWRATGVVSLLAMLLLIVQTQWWRAHHPHLNADKDDKANPGDHLEVGDCVTFVIGAISQQGFYCTPVMVSARITIITTFIANLFLFTSFSGSIVAIIQSPSHALRTVHDLIRSDMKVGVQDIRFQHVWFQEAEKEHDVASEVFRKKVKTHEPPGFVKTREGIASMRSGMYAFQVETNEGYREILDTFTESEKCDLSELELFPAAPMVFCTTEKSPYREALSRSIRWQRETGLLDRIHQRWESQRPTCSSQKGVFVPIGLQEFYPALLVVYNGMVLALAILLAEHVYSSRAVASCLLRSWRKKRGISAELLYS